MIPILTFAHLGAKDLIHFKREHYRRPVANCAAMTTFYAKCIMMLMYSLMLVSQVNQFCLFRPSAWLRFWDGLIR